MSQRSKSIPGQSHAQVRFFADAMLGALARWLRVLGCDTFYRRRMVPGEIEKAAVEGRVTLTRNRNLAARVRGSVLIESDHVEDQLKQLAGIYPITARPENRFSLCIECNTRLEDAPADQAREMVPDYVFHATPGPFKRCPSCDRFFWPGSHRKRMIEQLRLWDIDSPPPLC